ncbi:MAG: hypothetical protein V2A73_02440 [Pseudomonadota bacterium]
MGSVYPRRRRWWIKYRKPDGRWQSAATEYCVDRPGDKEKARKTLELVEERIEAGAPFDEGTCGPVTVARYSPRWLEKRKELGISDWQNDESRLRIHILPALGEMAIDKVRARHVADFVHALRTSKARKLAQRTVLNVYSVLKALFRDATIDGLVERSPCILSHHHLGESIDADPEWRDSAIYSRDELETLISSEKIPLDRRVFYALQGLAGLRHGEAAGLCWRHYEPTKQPLGRLLIRRSYDHPYTKTKKGRDVPVHPTLAAMLAEWKLGGWATVMGRQPIPDDLIVPLPPDEWELPGRGKANPRRGGMRSKCDSYKRLCRDQVALGLRHRRGHDFRRTMISLARNDGANKDILAWATHGRSRAATIDEYTTFEWATVCGEVGKLRIGRQQGTGGTVVPLHGTADGTP